MKRREFVNKSASAAGGAMAAPAFIENMITRSPNERINVALAGISGERERVRGMIFGRGRVHINTYAEIPNVALTKICDVDERLFPGVIATVEKLYGEKPRTEVDFRKLLEDKDIDVISIATPDHWHALMTVWACQAGKDVYVTGAARRSRKGLNSFMTENLARYIWPRALLTDSVSQ
jgi:hypothetical protein